MPEAERVKRPTEQVISRLGANATVKFYPKGYHMLLRDLDGGTRWSDIAVWIAQQAKTRSPPQMMASDEVSRALPAEAFSEGGSTPAPFSP